MTEDKLNPAHPLNGDESTFNDATIAPDHSAIDTSGTDRAVVSAPNIDPSAAKKNYTMTAAHKAKLSAAMKARHSRQKMESVPATVTDTPEICFRPSNANVDCNVLAIAAPVEVFGSGTPTKPEPLSDLSTSEPMSPKTTAEITADLLVQCFKWIRRYAVVSEDQAVHHGSVGSAYLRFLRG
jgi:hypothetical protein